MCDSAIIPEAVQPIEVSLKEEKLQMAIVKETIRFPVDAEGIHVAIHEERLEVSSPLVLAAPGWPFGPNPNKTGGLKKNEATVVDTVTMPTYYRVAQWLFLIEDEVNGLAVTSTIKCVLLGDNVHYLEYAVIGDSGMISYDLDANLEGDKVNLVVTSGYDGGDLTVRTSKIGIFH